MMEVIGAILVMAGIVLAVALDNAAPGYVLAGCGGLILGWSLCDRPGV